MRRRQALQVSTFPFLAVLLCAMGSLILFLLVIDRRAKIVARARAQASLQHVEKEEERLAAERAAELERRRQELRALLQNQLNQVEVELHGLTEQFTQATSAEEVSQERQREVALMIDKTQQEIERQQQGLIQWRADQAKKDWLNAKARAEVQRLAADLAKLESTLVDLRKLRSQMKETYSLVPYRGRYGDSRRPVYVECAADRIVLHPGAQELNPLRADATEVRQAIDRRLTELAAEAGGPSEKKAYILLLIRPAGIEAFRLVASAMRGLDIDFGYELIEDDWVLDFSTPNQAQPWTATTAVKPAPKSDAPIEDGSGFGLPGRGSRFGGSSSPGNGGDGSGGVAGWPGGGNNGSGSASEAPGSRPGNGVGWPGGNGSGSGGSTGWPGGSNGSGSASGAPGSRPGNGAGWPGGNGSGSGGSTGWPGGSNGSGSASGAPGSRPGNGAGWPGGNGSGSGGGTVGRDTGSPGGNGNGPGAAGSMGWPGGNGSGVGGSSSVGGTAGSPTSNASGTNGGSRFGMPGSGNATGAGGNGSTQAGLPGNGGQAGNGQPGTGPGNSSSGAVAAPAPNPGSASTSASAGSNSNGGSNGAASGAAGTSVPRPLSQAITVPGSENSTAASGPARGGAGAAAPGQGNRSSGTAQSEDGLLPRKSRNRLMNDSPETDAEGGGSPGDVGECPPSLGGTRSGGSRPQPRRDAGTVTQTRDWTLIIDCRAEEVALSTGQRMALADWPRGGARADHPLLRTVEDLIRRRSAAGKSNKPQIQFRVYPDGLRTYYLAFPALEPLQLLMKRENVDPDEEE